METTEIKLRATNTVELHCDEWRPGPDVYMMHLKQNPAFTKVEYGIALKTTASNGLPQLGGAYGVCPVGSYSCHGECVACPTGSGGSYYSNVKNSDQDLDKCAAFGSSFPGVCQACLSGKTRVKFSLVIDMNPLRWLVP